MKGIALLSIEILLAVTLIPIASHIIGNAENLSSTEITVLSLTTLIIIIALIISIKKQLEV